MAAPNSHCPDCRTRTLIVVDADTDANVHLSPNAVTDPGDGEAYLTGRRSVEPGSVGYPIAVIYNSIPNRVPFRYRLHRCRR